MFLKSQVRDVRVMTSALLLTLFFAIQPMTSAAQSEPEQIEPEQIETGILGEPQVIEADVGAETELSKIDLFYRFASEREFRSLPMSDKSQAGIYQASVPTVGVESNQMEFYILAEAVDGDTLLKGSAFAPIIRTLAEPSADGDRGAEEPAVASGQIEPLPEPTSNRSRYLYIALGVLAVGAIAAAASGGDGGEEGGSQPEPCGAAGCDLTIELPNP